MTPAQRANAVASVIQRRGAAVTLPDGSTLQAIDIMGTPKAARYLRADDLNAPEKLTTVIDMAGSVYTNKQIVPGMIVHFSGIQYQVEAPLHPENEGATCLIVSVVLSKN